jgi:hypothetical protein
MRRKKENEVEMTTTTTSDRLLTRAEAADLLRLKPQTLGKWAMTGRHLPVVHVGRSARYRLSDVQRLIEQGSPEPSTMDSADVA